MQGESAVPLRPLPTGERVGVTGWCSPGPLMERWNLP